MTEQLLYADPDTGEIKPFNTMMPPAIAAAIVAVKKDVKQIGADDQNKFGGYAYVSVDKIYDKIGRLMAANGLALMIDEIASEIRGGEAREGGKAPSPWLFVRYSLAFVHESGAMATPVHRSLAMPINGPQTYGAAQSYVEKQFLRQIFKIPTGEKDADETEQREGTAPVSRPAARQRAEANWGGNGSQEPVQRATALPDSPVAYVAPHAVDRSLNTVPWGKEFCAGIRTSRDRADYENWLTWNQDWLDEIKEANPMTWRRIEPAILETNARLGPEDVVEAE